MSHDADNHRHDDIGCLQAIEAFYAYLDGELDDPESIANFEQHLSHCRSCFSRVEVERILTERIRDSRRSRAPEALRARLKDLMKKY